MKKKNQKDIIWEGAPTLTSMNRKDLSDSRGIMRVYVQSIAGRGKQMRKPEGRRVLICYKNRKPVTVPGAR